MPLFIYLWKSMEILLMLVWFWFWSHASDTVGSKDIRNLWHEARYACVTPRGRPCKSWRHALFFLLHDSKIMQPLIKPTVRRHLRTCQDLVDTLSHKAAGFLYRTFQSFIQSTNTIRGSRPVCNPDWHAVQTWSSLVSSWASASNCPQPGCQPQPGSLAFFSTESQTQNLHLPLLHFLLPLTFPSRSI